MVSLYEARYLLADAVVEIAVDIRARALRPTRAASVRCSVSSACQVAGMPVLVGRR